MFCGKVFFNNSVGDFFNNFFKKETPKQVFFYKFYEISKNWCFVQNTSGRMRLQFCLNTLFYFSTL